MTVDTVMLLIDADNVSIDVIEQSVAWVAKHYGGPHLRRAYCTAESAVKLQQAFRRLNIRPMVNLAAGKNSTDIALAVDAIDLACSQRPDVVVIASSDSDFAPLVSRLREKGCRVVGIGQQGKTGDETVAVYDDFEVLAHRKAAARTVAPADDEPAAPRKTRARKTTARAAPATPAPEAPAPEPAAPRKAGRKTTARKSAAKAVPQPAPRAEPWPDKASDIRQAIPELAGGGTVELRVAAERLRDAQLLSRSASSVKLFRQFPALFELLPDEQQPQRVRVRPGQGS